jgi:hypothetical protein
VILIGDELIPRLLPANEHVRPQMAGDRAAPFPRFCARTSGRLKTSSTASATSAPTVAPSDSWR